MSRHHERRHPRAAPRGALHDLLEILALHQLHDDEVVLARPAQLVHPDDVGVAQLFERLELAQLEALLPGRERFLDHLDRDGVALARKRGGN